MRIASEDLAEDEDFAPDPNAKQRHFLIFTDESGMHRSSYYAFGALWMHWERRGDFQAFIRGLREKHQYWDEMKWGSIGRRPQFYEEVVDGFFRRSWLMFHSIVIRRQYVDLSLHAGSLPLAMQKHFTMFLSAKIRQYATKGKRYRVHVDRRDTRFKKADEVAGIISNHNIDNALGLRPIDSVRFHDSKRSPGIQLADVLLGCVYSAWECEEVIPAKVRIRKRVAAHLGWEDLDSDTRPTFGKFNIWNFWSRGSGEPRPVQTRDVNVALPGWSPVRVPARRSRR